MNDRALPTVVAERLKAWDQQRWFWIRWRYIFGIGSIAISLAITVLNNVLPEPKAAVTILGGLATALTSALALSKASEKANALNKAWRLLDTRRAAFLLDPSIDEKTFFTDAITKAEALIESAD